MATTILRNVSVANFDITYILQRISDTNDLDRLDIDNVLPTLYNKSDGFLSRGHLRLTYESDGRVTLRRKTYIQMVSYRFFGVDNSINTQLVINSLLSQKAGNSSIRQLNLSIMGGFVCISNIKDIIQAINLRLERQNTVRQINLELLRVAENTARRQSIPNCQESEASQSLLSHSSLNDEEASSEDQAIGQLSSDREGNRLPDTALSEPLYNYGANYISCYDLFGKPPDYFCSDYIKVM